MTTMTTGTAYKMTTNPDGSVSFAAVPPSPPSTVPLGYYNNFADAAAVAAFETWLGKPVPLALAYLDCTSWATISNPMGDLSMWTGVNRRMILAANMFPTGQANANTHRIAGVSFAEGAAGAYDQYHTAAAATVKAAGIVNPYVRIGAEFNGNWGEASVQSSDAVNFRTYFARIAQCWRNQLPACKIVWNPNFGDLGVGDLMNFYPGDQYVDVMAVDVYDSWIGTGPPILTQPYGLNWLITEATAHSKHWGLAECGLQVPPQVINGQNYGGDDPAFVTMIHSFVVANLASCAFVGWWDNGGGALALNPNSQTTFKQLFG